MMGTWQKDTRTLKKASDEKVSVNAIKGALEGYTSSQRAIAAEWVHL